MRIFVSWGPEERISHRRRKFGGGETFRRVCFAAFPFGIAISLKGLKNIHLPHLPNRRQQGDQHRLRIRPQGKMLIPSLCCSSWTEKPSAKTADLLSKPERNSPEATINTGEQRAVNLKPAKGSVFLTQLGCGTSSQDAIAAKSSTAFEREMGCL